MKNQDIKHVEDILNALDVVEKQEAPLTLQYRLANYSFHQHSHSTAVIWKYALASCIVIFLTLNIIAVKIYKQRQEAQSTYKAIIDDYEIGQNMLEKTEIYE
jgi:hypothetical protein